MKTITVEEHFISPGFLAGPGKEFMAQIRGRGPRGAEILAQLQDVGPERIAAMDAAGIDVQVLSLNSPGVEQASPADQVAVAAEANDFVADAKRRHPDRFSALAVLPTATPAKAAAELEHRIGKQGFAGAVINGHTRGRYLDDPFFWPILECAVSLDAPIYLHPTVPVKAVVDATYGGFAAPVTSLFATGAWGWHIETATHLLRMILGGVFDRYPKLQIVIGHLGEGIPFMLPRLNRNLPKEATKLQRSIAEYLRENVHYTFGGFNFPNTFESLIQEVGFERIMFSVDYPFGSMAEARTFLESLPLSDNERDRIAHGNAEKLFRL
jgi:predicted TIM-barrel fold metal-dependent hydrolase